jgi:hypothetical protein
MPITLQRELDTFRRRLREFLQEHDGEYVLIKGDDVIGFWRNEDQAVAEGDRRFLLQPFMVKKVQSYEKPVVIPFFPCQS